mmetsp:Transcript_9399/g.20609  ORF Transcript_9399/g.20609 Transcript_9399/m.20609 type:complete len:234 (+) Transcript_9399:1013-1714(+)
MWCNIIRCPVHVESAILNILRQRRAPWPSWPFHVSSSRNIRVVVTAVFQHNVPIFQPVAPSSDIMFWSASINLDRIEPKVQEKNHVLLGIPPCGERPWHLDQLITPAIVHVPAQFHFSLVGIRHQTRQIWKSCLVDQWLTILVVKPAMPASTAVLPTIINTDSVVAQLQQILGSTNLFQKAVNLPRNHVLVNCKLEHIPRTPAHGRSLGNSVVHGKSQGGHQSDPHGSVGKNN